VLVAERRPVVGVPVRCAEYIPAQLMGLLPAAKPFIVQALKGMRTHLPDGEIKETAAPGFTVRRDVFDQTLAQAARQAGARVLLATRAVSREGGVVLLRGPHGEPLRVRPRIIIGADGPHSTVGRWVGSQNRHLIPGVQVRVPLAAPMEFTEVHFHPDIRGGYGWLFPRGREANVGIGARLGRKPTRSLGGLLREFIDRLAAAGKVVPLIKGRTAGWIPAETPRAAWFGNVLLAGDAAGQTHPITGAGIFPAVACGQLAGKWAARAALAGEIDLLAHYDAEWRDTFSESLQRAFDRRRLLEAEWDRLDTVLRSCWVAFREFYARPE
jgi:flavin-dependent dehydrogenase